MFSHPARLGQISQYTPYFQHDLYINTHPRLKALEAEPERYVLRVLSFDETMTCFEDNDFCILSISFRADLMALSTN